MKTYANIIFWVLLSILLLCSCDDIENTTNGDVNNMEKSLFPFQNIDSKWGYMDIEGNTIIKPQYDSASYFTDNKAVVTIEGKNSDKYGYINKNGDIVVPIIYDWAAPYSNGLYFVKKMKNPQADHGGETWIYMNDNGEVVLQLTDKDFYLVWPGNGGLSNVAKDAAPGSWGCIDITGDYIIKPQYSGLGYFCDGLAWFRNVGGRDSKFGFINKENEIVIPEMYEAPGDFSEGIAPVKLNGKWGYINGKNEIVIEFKFDDAKSFSESVAAVNENGLWGVIDHTGEYVIPPQYPNLSNSYNGLFMVQKNLFDFDYYVNLNGEIIKPKTAT